MIELCIKNVFSVEKDSNMRLDKFLNEAGIGAKKRIRNDIKSGKVTVNQQIILNPAIEINEVADDIRFLGEVVIHSGKSYYMFHKPAGCVTARQDDGCKTVLDYFDEKHKKGISPVGRLDKDTEGLLLLTNDGDFNHRLMHPDMHVEKTYFFWALGALENKDLKRLQEGVKIRNDEEAAKAIRIEVVKEGKFHEFQNEMNMENTKEVRINPNQQPVVSGYITISEGRKHQIKRMLKAVGCYVVYLKRVSIGGLDLDETLEKGQYREMKEHEFSRLYL
jgi:pseudouridine synthase